MPTIGQLGGALRWQGRSPHRLQTEGPACSPPQLSHEFWSATILMLLWIDAWVGYGAMEALATAP
jgi:hypothetical protein